MGESGVLFAQSLVVLGWVYRTGACLVLGMRWADNSRGNFEGVVKLICIVATLMVLWGFALKPAMQTVYAHLSDDKTVECVKVKKGMQ